ncbi:MAG: gliding motility-associated C-terminal domain-containing protein [Allomuricauda sp.]|nr:MAG: gliding motility-associated C-terminal domain-containing protein [Allomuricauda sp.]
MTIQYVSGQLGFCSGNSGDPIFTETFGTGIENGPALPAGTTTYNYVNGPPQDGSYTISSSTENYFDWFDISDHTPGDTNGKAFIVNASFEAGEFFRRSVDGLCENTSYEFSSWLMNLHPSTSPVCQPQGIPINVRFQIWDSTDTQLLASGDTGAIFDKASPIWEQYALVFRTLPGQTSVILKMLNNGAGGCGNDLAIDDIVFKTCGDKITVQDMSNNSFIHICREEAPITTTLSATPDFLVFQDHYYQWQESTDGENWTDIVGETNQDYTTPILNTTTYYRVKVAEDPINLTNSKCNVVSDVFDIMIIDKPDAPIMEGDVELCADNPGGVLVTVPEGVTVNWYDAPTGGNLLEENTIFYATDTNGTYYAEAVTLIAGCISDSRTAVTITYYELPEVTDESLTFCEEDSVVLFAGIQNANYLWNTNETSETITVSVAGIYSVLITNENGCSSTKTIVVEQIDLPIIETVTSNHRTITISTANSGDFEYSLDGIVYQDSPVFEQMEGGLYFASVRGKMGCGFVETPYIHLVIPRFFTPNGDGINDRFRVEGGAFFETFKISIFDRTAKLLAQSNDQNFVWDGSHNNRPLPSADYWYVIEVGDQSFKGHFTLKR